MSAPTTPGTPHAESALHEARPCTGTGVRVVSLDEVAPNRRRGGDLRVTLSPTTVGSTSGFMGLAILLPGETISEHYHPYSEEFVHLVCGSLEVDLDGVTHELRAEQSLMIPRDMRHRFRNTGREEARMVFQLAPLAPKPELGHVDTEALADPHESHPGIGGGP
ncbi:cupin domain-containing protein [Yinghuangia soli]|uniref:Cupin domain-containing protein n=1 Tax=Yinghuangia soli TaxID=2908204 RepID=A0AA41Q508_9ACTN|nr:cupin domain-containing protein [Yinghuangia soli]MCF2531065.1 cupin domain-containing protein [Yinghuangia soli]